MQMQMCFAMIIKTKEKQLYFNNKDKDRNQAMFFYYLLHLRCCIKCQEIKNLQSFNWLLSQILLLEKAQKISKLLRRAGC